LTRVTVGARAGAGVAALAMPGVRAGARAGVVVAARVLDGAGGTVGDMDLAGVANEDFET